MCNREPRYHLKATFEHHASPSTAWGCSRGSWPSVLCLRSSSFSITVPVPFVSDCGNQASGHKGVVCGALGVFTQQTVHGNGPRHTWQWDASILGCAWTSAYSSSNTHAHTGWVLNDPLRIWSCGCNFPLQHTSDTNLGKQLSEFINSHTHTHGSLWTCRKVWHQSC